MNHKNCRLFFAIFFLNFNHPICHILGKRKKIHFFWETQSSLIFRKKDHPVLSQEIADLIQLAVQDADEDIYKLTKRLPLFCLGSVVKAGVEIKHKYFKECHFSK